MLRMFNYSESALLPLFRLFRMFRIFRLFSIVPCSGYMHRIVNATLDGGGELLLAHLRLNQTVEGARCKTFHASQGWWEEFSAKLPAVVGWEIDGRDLICAYEYGSGLSTRYVANVVGL
jgi:hypothetical protein